MKGRNNTDLWQVIPHREQNPKYWVLREREGECRRLSKRKRAKNI
jgi:hypothetical protein